MQLSNPFPQEVRLLFIDCFSCWECGQNGQNCGGLELHHIWGRVSGSALNAAVLCKRCHDHILHNTETHRRLLKKTISFLAALHYKLVARDDAFLAYVQNDLQGFVPW